ncbi:MAG: DNA-binding protein WhiA [Synergistaceae bacterium]
MEQILWDEWVLFPPVTPVEDEISGIIDGLSYTKDLDGHYSFQSNRLFILRRLIKLFNSSSYYISSETSGENIKFISAQQKTKVTFTIKKQIAELIIKRSNNIGRRVRNWNWVRGIWGSCGSLYIPKAGYYLIIRPPEKNNAPERLQTILKSVGFAVGVRKRQETREIILRDQQQIVTFLSKIGFVQTTLALEEMAMYRSMRSHANKLVNCDSANINKSLVASQSQLLLIKELEDRGMIEEIPSSLKDLIIARKLNPSISLKELGESLPTPISKSTVEYRWRKLEKILGRY